MGPEIGIDFRLAQPATALAGWQPNGAGPAAARRLGCRASGHAPALLPCSSAPGIAIRKSRQRPLF